MKRPLFLALAGLMLAGAPTIAQATATTAAAPPPAFPQLLPSGKSWRVTLLTGDVVRLSTAKGRPPLVSVQPAPGRRSALFRKDYRPDGSVRVFPLDVASRIGKVYDPALFDITTLIKEGDDDAKRADLPLIIQGGSGATRAFAARRTLKSIHAVSVRQPKTSAAGLDRKVRDEGIQHVWLDRKVHVQALDHNLDQVSAPTAWNAGATGKGVKVAVLDTGVDATHPDLVGRIAEQRNFSPSPDTVDRIGHGTHVAATIAGTGAAADGERRGVAPDADLLVGKVIGDDGSSEDSLIIAGMEWAAANAKVVSMSLGRFSDDPANDPISQAVEKLTAQDGTLFVVAAGNNGVRDSIEAPGAAASALAVGAVDGTDRVADFSSRGGKLMKPEIAAPGVDIIAARAKDTSIGHVIDARYTALSGTSMATPHVAGAAADLLQKHPDWGPARLKAALTSTADAAPDTVYDVGAGRLNVGTAVTATVVGDQANAAFGSIPHDATASLAKQLSWTNTSPSAITLHLAATIADPAGNRSAALSLPPQVTVPAGGSAGVTLTLDPRHLTTPGLYSGAVTAQAPGVSLRTAIGASAEPQTHALTLKATAIPGTPAGALGGLFDVVDLDNPDLFFQEVEIGPDGVTTLQVPDGTYAVYGTVDDATPENMRSAFVGNFELKLRGDTTMPVDASHAQPVRVSAPGATPDTSAVHGLAIERTFGDEIIGTSVIVIKGFGATQALSTPVAGVRTGTLQAYVLDRLTDGGKTVYDVLHNLGSSVPAAVNYKIDPSDMAQLDERFGAINGKTEVPDHPKRYGFTPNGFIWNEAEGDVPAGSARTDFVTGEPGVGWLDEAFGPDLGSASWVNQMPIQHFDAGHRFTEDWLRQPFHPGPYSATSPTISFCAPSPSTRSRGDIHIDLVDLQDKPDQADCLTDAPDWLDVSSRKMTLYAGDAQAGSTTLSHGDFSVPPTEGTYRLRYDVDAAKALPVSTRTSTEWTFRSSPSVERIPLLTIDYTLPLDLLNHPNGDTATFTVAQVAGSTQATVTGLKLWTSLDDGATWQPAHVTGTAGKYTAQLPHPAAGHAVSLRTVATDAQGGKIDQTIIRAYFGS